MNLGDKGQLPDRVDTTDATWVQCPYCGAEQFVLDSYLLGVYGKEKWNCEGENNEGIGNGCGKRLYGKEFIGSHFIIGCNTSKELT